MDEVWISLFIFEHKTAAYDEHVVKQGRVKRCQILALMVREAHDVIIFVILIIMSQDIRNQRRYRQRRKAELVKLQQTYAALNSKATFYGEQVDYYKSYIKTCLDNLASKGKWVLL